MLASINQTSRAEAYDGYYINRIKNTEMMCCFRVWYSCWVGHEDLQMMLRWQYRHKLILGSIHGVMVQEAAKHFEQIFCLNHIRRRKLMIIGIKWNFKDTCLMSAWIVPRTVNLFWKGFDDGSLHKCKLLLIKIKKHLFYKTCNIYFTRTYTPHTHTNDIKS